jgi:hypothetical protein
LNVTAIMREVKNSFGRLLVVLGLVFPGAIVASVGYDARIPQLRFAAEELNDAMTESGREDLEVSLIVQSNASSPEAFQIRVVAPNQIEVAGSDATGAMYGGLEVADRLKLRLPIEDEDQAPFVEKRGIKFNIPLDARTPSYDDTGDSAQKSIETMWDFGFWKAYLDDLARYRYNVLSLWTTHPFPSLIKLENYPDVALDDVYRISDGILQPHHKNKLQDVDFNEPGTIERVRRMSIDEKIAHWQRVFQYAEDRGIEVYFFCWNLFTWYAEGKYGITQQQDNPRTIEYTRACVRQLLLTYPQISGIGVTAGENADWYLEGDRSIETFIFKTFGRGIMDVQEDQPGRDIRFIFRRHVTEHPEVTRAFKDYTGGTVDTSIKYAVAHIYSSRRPQEWEKRIVDEGWLDDYRVWLNLRNDDIFMHRWGSPDFVREFIRWMPHDHSPGFYMGSDGYVWAREFIAKNPEMTGRLEIDKHWYRFRLWGQLAYNNDLGRDYWEAVLKHRFPCVNAGLLYDAWESTSEIIPQLNRSVWAATDGDFSAEGCMQRSGFLTVDDYHFDRDPMVLTRIENAPDPQCISVTDWARAFLAGQRLAGVTPLQVAERLDHYAAAAQAALPSLRKQAGDNVELLETLNDIESMACLGRYYADKMRGAAKLAVFREGNREDKQYLDQAVDHLKDAVKEWKAYAAILSAQYSTSLLARTHFLDWNATLKEVEKEVVTVQQEQDYPEVRFSNLKDGAQVPAGTDLRVEVEASDGDGDPEVRLSLNGLSLKAHAENPQVWSGESDEILTAIQPGFYHLEAVAEDVNGLRAHEAIQITVGDRSSERAGDWKDEIHQVILNEGEQLKDGEIREFPRLECFLTLEEDGRLALFAGASRGREGLIWKTRGKADRPTPQPVPYRFYAALAQGQLRVCRGTPEKPDVVLWTSPKPSTPGPYQLGITASKRLVIYREVDGNREVVWKG